MSIRERILKELTRGRDRAPNTIYITELVQCPLKARLSEEKTSPDVALTIGSAVHRVVQDIFREEAEVEVPVRHRVIVDGVEYDVHGRVDLYFPDKSLMVEVKTTSLSEENLPQASHLLQIALYNTLLPCDSAVLLYIKKRGPLEEAILEYVVSEREEFSSFTTDHLDGLVRNYLSRDNAGPVLPSECASCYLRYQCPRYRDKEKAQWTSV